VHACATLRPAGFHSFPSYSTHPCSPRTYVHHLLHLHSSAHPTAPITMLPSRSIDMIVGVAGRTARHGPRFSCANQACVRVSPYIRADVMEINFKYFVFWLHKNTINKHVDMNTYIFKSPYFIRFYYFCVAHNINNFAFKTYF
jgi:hypothetical protein